MKKMEIARIQRLRDFLINPNTTISTRLRTLYEADVAEFEKDQKRSITEDQIVSDICGYWKMVYPHDPSDGVERDLECFMQRIEFLQNRVKAELKTQFIVSKCLHDNIPEWLQLCNIRVDKEISYPISYNTGLGDRNHSSLCFDGMDWQIHVIFTTDTYLVIDVILLSTNMEDLLKTEEDLVLLKKCWTEAGFEYRYYSMDREYGFGFICGTINLVHGLFHAWSTGNPDRICGVPDIPLSTPYTQLIKDMKEWGSKIIK